MKFSLKVTESEKDISKLILDHLTNQINKIIDKALPTIIQNIQTLVKESLISEPEYASLKAGTLRAEFGISNTENVDLVIDAMVSTINITRNPIKSNNNGLTGGFKLTMIKSDDINGLIYTDIGSVNDSEKGYSLPWLEWLLLQGNKTIIKNYSVSYTSNPRSRSGLALMIESNSNWRVPSNFSGTQSNNWTTRAISKINDKIIEVIQNNIEKYL